ncbi:MULTISPECIES: Nif11 family protein [unclassified Anaerobiospirillum]|uniref:Nif11 family protein n=1 Tax=unclassified Anaerobiospirillum TaxID=2647410 RepID=UPI001FF490A2|nr:MULTISPECIES: Nif11 family protein [unclassified Anaerobiospirillum]MCK0527268.1 Nif11 family protein [Anaerobiospirillum sp. NML120449]MCK0534356.1 Nif11 family protein [Anaerobiospirillum sp. NML120511]MCK0539676.1 Nif11 family protein [Anaerobiospirillum sp. NML02-A-032]
MSIQAINDLFTSLDKNEELTKEFESIRADDKFRENLVALGKKHGFEFTLQELEDVAACARAIQQGEKAE